MYIAIIKRVVLLRAAGDTASLCPCRQGKYAEIGQAGAIRALAIAVITVGISGFADPAQWHHDGPLVAIAQGKQQANIERGNAHLMITNSGPGGCAANDFRVDIKEGTLPLGIGALQIGVVAQQQEQVYRFVVGLLAVVGKETLLYRQCFPDMRVLATKVLGGSPRISQ